jgi:galactokinase
MKASFFKGRETKKYFSPGRVNLIGEHIDYNGGLVFPAAIQLGTYGTVAINRDRLFRFYSKDFHHQGVITRSIDDMSFNSDDGWANYAKGILDNLIQKGHPIDFGFDIYVEGNLPTASGLSSSASLEVLIAFIANDLYNLGMKRVEMALLAQEVENDYMGMHCGIMDQLSIACGQKNKAMLMNTATLEIEHVDAKFEGYSFMIMNTNYKRKTTESKYNERRRECMEALKVIQTKKSIRHLCELTLDDFDSVSHLLIDPIIKKRAKHAVTEQDRTLKAKDALRQKDAYLFAKLLNESHKSLKEDYGVTGLHLDVLTHAALKHGAIGARVTGAGFGGCAIALIPNEKLVNFGNHVNQIYKEKTNLVAIFYEVNLEDGVRRIDNESNE